MVTKLEVTRSRRQGTADPGGGGDWSSQPQPPVLDQRSLRSSAWAVLLVVDVADGVADRRVGTVGPDEVPVPDTDPPAEPA